MLDLVLSSNVSFSLAVVFFSLFIYFVVVVGCCRSVNSTRVSLYTWKRERKKLSSNDAFDGLAKRGRHGSSRISTRPRFNFLFVEKKRKKAEEEEEHFELEFDYLVV